MASLRPYAMLVVIAVLLAAPASYFALKLDQVNDEQREMYAYANLAAKKDIIKLYDEVYSLSILRDKLEKYGCNTSSLSSVEPGTYTYYVGVIGEARTASSNLESLLDIMYTVKKKPGLERLKDSVEALSYYLDNIGKELTKSKADKTSFNCSLLPDTGKAERLSSLLRGIASRYDDIGDIRYEEAEELYSATVDIVG